MLAGVAATGWTPGPVCTARGPSGCRSPRRSRGRSRVPGTGASPCPRGCPFGTDVERAALGVGEDGSSACCALRPARPPGARSSATSVRPRGRWPRPRRCAPGPAHSGLPRCRIAIVRPRRATGCWRFAAWSRRMTEMAACSAPGTAAAAKCTTRPARSPSVWPSDISLASPSSSPGSGTACAPGWPPCDRCRPCPPVPSIATRRGPASSHRSGTYPDCPRSWIRAWQIAAIGLPAHAKSLSNATRPGPCATARDWPSRPARGSTSSMPSFATRKAALTPARRWFFGHTVRPTHRPNCLSRRRRGYRFVRPDRHSAPGSPSIPGPTETLGSCCHDAGQRTVGAPWRPVARRTRLPDVGADFSPDPRSLLPWLAALIVAAALFAVAGIAALIGKRAGDTSDPADA